MLKRSGTILVAVLVVVAAVVVFSGALNSLMPAEQLSPTAQSVIDPDKVVSENPFTSLRNLKNKKVKLATIKATVGIVDDELITKLKASQEAYDSIFGTIKQPGYVGVGLVALLTAVGTTLYNKKSLYTADEVKLVKNGETVL